MPDGAAQRNDMTTTPQLLATCWTTAGRATPDGPTLRSPLSVEERIAAAEALGTKTVKAAPDTSAPADPDRLAERFDALALINAVRATRFDGMRGVEMLSSRHRSLPRPQALREAREAPLACFAEAELREFTNPAPGYTVATWAGERPASTSDTASAAMRNVVAVAPSESPVVCGLSSARGCPARG